MPPYDPLKPQPLPGAAPDPYAAAQPVAGGMPAIQPFNSETTTNGFTNHGEERIQKERSPQIDSALLDSAEATESQANALKQQQADLAEREAGEAAAADAKHSAAIDETARINSEREARQHEYELAKASAAEQRAQMEKANHITSYWDDKGVPAKIFASILVGLGEGASGGTGQSAALRIFDAAEAKDHAEKLRKFEVAEKSSGRADALSGDARKRFEETQANFYIVKANALATQLEAAKAKLPSGKQAVIEQTIGELHAKAADKTLTVEQDLAATVHGAHRDTTGGSSNTSVTGSKEGSSDKVAPDLTVTGPDGKQYLAKSLKEADELRKKVASYQAAEKGVEELKSLNEQKGRLPSPSLAPSIHIAAKNLLEAKKDLYGALTPTDVKDFSDSSTTGLTTSAEAAGKGLDQYKGGMKAQLDASLSTQARPVQEAAPTSTPRRTAADQQALIHLQKHPEDAAVRKMLENKGIYVPKAMRGSR